MKPLHILHTEAATGWGGQEIRVFQETQLLLERGHQVTIICRPGSPLAQKCQSLAEPGFRYFPVRMNRSWSPAAFVALLGHIRTLRPDIIHTHSSIDSWLASPIGKLLGIPIVRSRHISIPVKGGLANRLIYCRWPDRIITSGDAISDILVQSGVKQKKVTSISAGVDLRRFDLSISGEPIRKELGLHPGQPLIGKIGVVRGWKGYDFFLEAIPHIMEERPDARFVIVGTGPGYDEIREKAATRGLNPALTFLGHRDDIPEIMAGLDVQVLASIAGEGTPQVIPQAFAMKTPVVATRIGSVSDLLGHGERGILVDPESGQKLAEGVLRLIKDPDLADRLSEKAFEFCRRELTVDRMMDQTLAVYRDVLNSRS